jgi:hypothetical protein
LRQGIGGMGWRFLFFGLQDRSCRPQHTLVAAPLFQHAAILAIRV